MMKQGNFCMNTAWVLWGIFSFSLLFAPTYLHASLGETTIETDAQGNRYFVTKDSQRVLIKDPSNLTPHERTSALPQIHRPYVPDGQMAGHTIDVNTFRPTYDLPPRLARRIFGKKIPAADFKKYHFVKNFRHTAPGQPRQFYYAAIPRAVSAINQINVKFPIGPIPDRFSPAAHGFQHLEIESPVIVVKQQESYQIPLASDQLPRRPAPYAFLEVRDVVVSYEAARPEGIAFNPLAGSRLVDANGVYPTVGLIGSARDYAMQLFEWRGFEVNAPEHRITALEDGAKVRHNIKKEKTKNKMKYKKGYRKQPQNISTFLE